MYITKKIQTLFSVLSLRVLSMCLASGLMFENVGFLREKSSSF